MRFLLSDLGFATRILRRQPTFTAAVALTLAIGIGANTAIFSVVNAVLLRPLALTDSERLVLVWGESPRLGHEQLPVSLPNFVDVRDAARSFSGMAVWAALPDMKFNVTGLDEPTKAQYAVVSAELFRVLGVRPRLGRGFQPDDDRRGAAEGIIVSDRLWRRHFTEAQTIAGAVIVLDGTPYPVIGVLPPDFRFVSHPARPDVWLPLGLDPFNGREYARGARSLGIIARLAPGVSLDDARAELGSIASALEREHPRFNTGLRLRAVSLREQAVGNVRAPLLILLGAVGVVLLIGCANVANLLLARAAARESELAVRSALGATRGRLVSQLLAESVVLALIGGILGLLIAVWGSWIPATAALAPPDLFTPVSASESDIVVDGRVLAFAMLVSLGTACVFGLFPAFRAARLDVQAHLRSRSIGGELRKSRRASELLVVTQVALSLALLIGAGLLARSFARLTAEDTGFQAKNVLGIELGLPRARYASHAQIEHFYEQLLARAREIPGVRDAGLVAQLPFSGPAPSTDLRIAGAAEAEPGEEPRAVHGAVTSGYFAAMGIRLVRGREIEASDDSAAPRVAVINEAMARRYWPNDDPVGKRFALSTEALRIERAGPPRFDWTGAMREVVGVVADVKRSGLGEPALPEVYVPFSQRPSAEMTLTIRTDGDPLAMVPSVRRLLGELDADQPFSAVHTMSGLVGLSLRLPLARTVMMAGFAILAVVLAGIGLYGVIAVGVARRTREIGIRVALGADRGAVVRLIVRRGFVLAATGVAAGLVLGAMASRLLSRFLHGVRPDDPTTLLGVAALVLVVSIFASWIPARRAARIDPALAMRD